MKTEVDAHNSQCSAEKTTWTGCKPETITIISFPNHDLTIWVIKYLSMSQSNPDFYKSNIA